jgi:probable HAF family extracellular repeat protein
VSSTWEACQAPRGSSSTSINDTGQEVGVSIVDGVEFATEWSGGNIINLEGLPGFTSSFAEGINDAGQVVGYSVVDGFTYATEWSDGNVVNLDPNNSSSIALAINDTGQVVGQSNINGLGTATEWDDGNIIGLGLLPRFLESSAAGINDVGQAVGTPRQPAAAHPRALDLGNDATRLLRLGLCWLSPIAE